MSNYGPTPVFLLVGGRDISSDTFTLDETVESLTEEKHPFGTSWEEHLPIGIARVTLEAAGGLYTDRVAGIMDALQEKSGIRQLVSYGMSGDSLGADAALLDGTYATTWKRMATRDGLTKAHAVHTITGSYLRGRVLNGRTAVTSDPGTSTTVDQALNPLLPVTVITSSDAGTDRVLTASPHGLTTGEVVLITGHTGSTPDVNGGHGYAVTVVDSTHFTLAGVDFSVGGTGGTVKKVSSLGASADLHVLALALGGYTNVLIKVQHSADDSSYSDLMTFTAVTTSPVAERKTVATQVNRYTHITWDFVGSGSSQSITPYVVLGRP
jgi:hypothetical protein